jgi:CDP-glycerol glycerophosphotransferase (TagB/SpsB family)
MNRKIKVAFLGLYFEAWDSLDEIYRLMLEDSRFEPTVISLPRKLTGQLKYTDEEKSHAFFESKGIKHLRLNMGGEDSSNQLGLEQLRQLAPDYVFVNYPWQRNYQPALRFDNLVDFTRLVYVPYFSLVMVDEPDDEPGGGQSGSPIATHLYKQRLHQLASLVFTQDRQVLDAYALTERGNSYVHFFGSPKIDSLRLEAEGGIGSWPLPSAEFKIIWAPHHSYSPHWLNFGVFAKIKDSMLNFARQNPNIQVVLRPHPFLWGTLIDRKVISEAELASWRRSWDELTNTAVDEHGSYAELFLATDALLTDGISFLGEFPLVTGKPAIFFENEGHWQFTGTGELAAASSIRVRTFEEFELAIDRAKTSQLENRSQEIAALIAASSPFPGQSARKIVEQVRLDFSGPEGPSKLIDKSSIKEIPWELVKGREPFED